jgi:glycosyltransferase involved in cell wall biosynthesis
MKANCSLVKDNELITIVVSVYNTENLTNRCIQSIVDQSYKNLEIIIINDGSTDRSIDVCVSFANLDDRIIVIDKVNEGLAESRNVGIKRASGKTVMFVDGDDFIDENMVRVLMQNMVKKNCDISICGYTLHYEGQPVVSLSTQTKCVVMDPENALEMMLYQHGLTTSSWGKLYASKLFRDIEFPQGKMCEDLGTTYKLFSRAKKVCLSDYKGYYYLQREGSIITSKFTPKRMDSIRFSRDIVDFVSAHYPEILNSANNRFFMESLFVAVSITDKSPTFTKHLLECEKIIKTTRKSVLSDSKSRTTYRIYAFLSYLGFQRLISLYKIKSSTIQMIRMKR